MGHAMMWWRRRHSGSRVCVCFLMLSLLPGTYGYISKCVGFNILLVSLFALAVIVYLSIKILVSCFVFVFHLVYCLNARMK